MDHNHISMASQDEQRLTFSVNEAAAALGISRDLVYDLLRTGQLQSLKAGRRRLISRQHLEDFLGGASSLASDGLPRSR